jgi:hypothetical protein
MSATHSPTEQLLGRDLVAIWHPQMRHPVQRRASDKQLRGLSVKAARTNPLAEDHLYSKDLCLGQRAAMIARLSLPLSAPFAPDYSQVLIADVSLSFRVAVLPDARPLLWWNRRSCLSATDRVITISAIIRSIGRDLVNLILNLLKQVGQQLRVLKIIGRDDYGHELKGHFIHAKVEFAPGATPRVAMLANFPFAFAIDLDASGIHDHVQWLACLSARQLNLQRAAATAQRCVTGHAQLHCEQLDDRARQPFGGPQRQMVNFFQSSHAEDSRVGIVRRLATLARARRVVPRRKYIFADPDGETSALDKSFVILVPVTETVRLLGFLFCHTSKIPATPSP